MRTLHILLLLLLLCGTVKAGNPPLIEQKKSLLFLNRDKAPTRPVNFLLRDTMYLAANDEMYQIESKLHSGKVLTITGISMLAAGGLLTYAATGFTNLANNANNSAVGPITGAVICYILGPGCLLAGVPLIVIGAERWSRGVFQRKLYLSRAKLYGSAGPNGAGVKVTF